MSNAIRTLVQDYGWIHTGIGLAGNTLFFLGSIAFLPTFKRWEEVGMNGRLWAYGSSLWGRFSC